MKFSRDDRGVSEVLGAILVFALLISVLSIVQVSGVPALNEQVEFEHNARVQDDMRGFASSVDTAAATGRDQPVDVETGVRYPPRLFLLNPGPTAGTLSTTGSSDVTFGNLEALDPEAGEYLNSTNAPDSYTTTGLVYQPNYNQYTVAPETRYEHGIIYNVDADDGVSVMDSGSIVSGKRISLTVLDGTLATSGGDSVSFTAVPVSGPSQVVSVRGANDEPMTLTLPTALSQSTWDELLKKEITDGYVNDVSVSGGKVTITFEAGVTYDLRLAKVAISGGVDDEPPVYVTTVPSIDADISENGGTVAAAVRDRFNNPVSGVEVRFYPENGSGSFPDGNTVKTNADGIAAVRFNPGVNTVTTDIYAGLDRTTPNSGNPFTNEPDAGYIVYTVSVTEANEPSTAGEINPVGNDALVLTDVELVGQSRGSGQADAVYNMTFENIGDADLVISEGRVNFYFASRPGSNDPPTSAVIVDPNDPNNDVDAEISEGYEPFDTVIVVEDGDEITLVVTFYDEDGDVFAGANTDDYYVLSLLTNGSPRTYFAAD